MPEEIFHTIINENFPHQRKGIPIQVQEAYHTPIRYNQNRNSPQQIIVKALVAKQMQDQENVLELQERKTKSY